MEMKEFVKIVKESKIAGNNQKEIIYMLLKALGAEGMFGRGSTRKPSESTVQKWLNGDTENIRTYEFFPNFKIENEEGAHSFLRELSKKDQWKKLRNLFKEWHNNKGDDKEFYICTETDDFQTFSTSFWRQFASYFVSLRMWDGVEEGHSEVKDNHKNINDRIVNEMIDIFRENFMLNRIYEYIPKEIEDVINSIRIYYEIMNEKIQFDVQSVENPECGSIQRTKRLYFKCSPNQDCFVFGKVTHYKHFWKLESKNAHMLIKYDEDFICDKMPVDTWLIGRVKYTAIKPSDLADKEFDEEMFQWKECQCEVIIIDSASINDGEETYPIIKDCYVLIDELLEQDRSVERFIAAIHEKIIKKYEGITFDNNSRILYNCIKQYRKSLRKFKKFLFKFRNLQKGKSEYLSDLNLKKHFSIYSYADFEVSSKPKIPFSELYIDRDEADNVISELYSCHRNLTGLYLEIFSNR